ncbi:flagellar hook-associated protein FlgK [Desulfosoma caldarium]|uniref:Flagellar hook-associated protein 1 n=1 Tax=Desulfosoma caldarium TaxID=610254 RepID=A0A3N1VGB6_9BACT|nr:flagellar hook-associated protein FlgK [Desulfosoma caldarium]ROR01903.1 flagellar hook-associated protein FlgK [Desulfosoma caldarium]
MAGLNAALEIAKNALFNAQVQIQTTSHNVANAENPAYARQKAPTVTQGAILGRAGWIGAGARLDRIVQQRDFFLEGRYLSASSQSAYYETLKRMASAVETYLSDDGETGINAALNEFWNAWNALAQNPEGSAEKALVFECGENLCSNLHQKASQIQQSQKSLLTELQDNLSAINELLEKIRNLNHQIQRSETPTFMANDLRDQRFQVLQELSTYLHFTTAEASGGMLNLFLEDGTPLVLFQEYAAKLTWTGDASSFEVTVQDSGKVVVRFNAADNEVQDGLQGSTGALVAAMGDVDSWKDALDQFAAALVTSFRDLYDDILGTPTSYFFDPAYTTAATIQLTDDPLPSPSNALARSVLLLQTQSLDDLDGLSLSEHLSQLSQDVGLTVTTASSQSVLYDAMTQQLDAQRQNISGVSLDEEMVELIKHQQLYQAAAKIVQQTAEMIQTAIQMV